MRAGFEYFRAFEKDAQDLARFAPNTIADADASSDWRKGFSRFLDSTGLPRGTHVEGVVAAIPDTC
jgi:hypothetical protein